MRLENDNINTEDATFFDNLENYVAIASKIQFEILMPSNNASTFNAEMNAPCLARNIMDEHTYAGVCERLCENVIGLLYFQESVQQ